jgi:hypothetical protein
MMFFFDIEIGKTDFLYTFLYTNRNRVKILENRLPDILLRMVNLTYGERPHQNKILDFDAPDHKMSGTLCHGLCVGVLCGVGVCKHLVSVDYRTNAWVD